MANAIKAKDIPEHAAKVAATRAKRQRNRDRAAARASKTFEQLTPPEKDLLLKEVAVKLGLIQDSEDS